MTQTPDEVLKAYETGCVSNPLDWPNALRAAIKQRDENHDLGSQWMLDHGETLSKLAERDRQLAIAVEALQSVSEYERGILEGLKLTSVIDIARAALAQIKGEGKGSD